MWGQGYPDTESRPILQDHNNLHERSYKSPWQNCSKLNPAICRTNNTSGPSGVCARNVRVFNMQKKINIIFFMKKNHTIFSIDTKKAYDKVQHPFKIKTFSKCDTSLALIKGIQTGSSPNTLFHEEALSSFFL